MDFIIVGCGKTKAPTPCPARELYTGCLFRAARAHAETSGRPWLILSALWGLIEPDRVLEPYDCRLTGPYWTWWDLRLRVWDQLEQLGWKGAIEVHAGAPYVEMVRAAVLLSSRRLSVTDTLAGLQVGQRRAWYRAERERRAA